MELGHKVQAPKSNVSREERGKAGIFSKEVVGCEIDPMAGGGVTGRHGQFLEGLDSGVQGGGVITVSGADVVRAKNGDKQIGICIDWQKC